MLHGLRAWNPQALQSPPDAQPVAGVAAPETNAQRADRLGQLLLAGAPSMEDVASARAQASKAPVISVAGSGITAKVYPEWHPVWDPDFVQRGEAFLTTAKATRARARLLKTSKRTK